MHMPPADQTDSKSIFKQLGELPPGCTGVHAVIENHDAWLHSATTLLSLNAATRAELEHRAASGPQAQRIQAQRLALQPLVTPLPTRLSSAV
jgi:hypothetical protein